MRIKIFILVFFVSAFAGAEVEIPEQPPSPCYSGCNNKMTRILNLFYKAQAPKLVPSVYSGECYHLSYNYSGDHTHYAVSMIDYNDLNQMKPYLSTIFSFFAPTNEYASWNLTQARKEMSDEWKTSCRDIKMAGGTARVEVLGEPNEPPAYIYWFRQDPKTGTLYMLTYWAGSYIISFCELKKNLNQ